MGCLDYQNGQEQVSNPNIAQLFSFRLLIGNLGLDTLSEFARITFDARNICKLSS